MNGGTGHEGQRGVRSGLVFYPDPTFRLSWHEEQIFFALVVMTGLQDSAFEDIQCRHDQGHDRV